MPRRRRTAAWGAAGVLPVALGIAASTFGATAGVGGGGGGGGSAAGTGAPGVEVGAATSLIAATDAIPRLGLSSPAVEVEQSWEKPVPNKSRLGDCGWYGSEGADKETNRRKNRTDLPPTYHAITFDALAGLEWPREAKTRRDKWTKAQLDEIRPYEGIAVTVTGFVVAVRPQKNNQESTNCNSTGEANTDWHVALVGEFGDKEPTAVVVEPTPRIKRRHPNWDPDSLKPVVGKPDSVRVSGYLLLDPVHKNHLGKYRQTLWEVHPIHRIELFQNGRWRDLDGD